MEMCSSDVFRKPEILSEVCRHLDREKEQKGKEEEKRLHALTRNKALLGLIISIIHVNFTFICNTGTHAVHVVLH